MPKPRLHKVSRILLIIFTILYAALLLPASAFALLSPFAFDSGTSTTAWTVFIFLVTFPINLVFSTVIAWVLYKFKLYPAALSIIGLPIVHVIVAFFVG